MIKPRITQCVHEGARWYTCRSPKAKQGYSARTARLAFFYWIQHHRPVGSTQKRERAELLAAMMFGKK